MSETTVAQPEERQLTREEAYQHLSSMLDRIDRDIATMIRGAGPRAEAESLWSARQGMLDAQEYLHVAWRECVEAEAAINSDPNT